MEHKACWVYLIQCIRIIPKAFIRIVNRHVASCFRHFSEFIAQIFVFFYCV